MMTDYPTDPHELFSRITESFLGFFVLIGFILFDYFICYYLSDSVLWTVKFSPHVINLLLLINFMIP